MGKYIAVSYLISKRFLDWDFDVRVVTDHDQLVSIAFVMFEMLGIVGIGVDSDVLFNFLSEISMTYRDNPFHNLRHAIFVSHYVFMLLRNSETASEEDGSLKQPSPSSLP